MKCLSSVSYKSLVDSTSGVSSILGSCLIVDATTSPNSGWVEWVWSRCGDMCAVAVGADGMVSLMSAKPCPGGLDIVL